MEKRRMVLFLLCAVLAAAVIGSQEARAAETQERECEARLMRDGYFFSDWYELPYAETFELPRYLSDGYYAGGGLTAARTNVYEYLYRQLRACASTVDVSGYSLTGSEMGAVFSHVINAHPDLFFVSGGYRYSGSSSTGYVTEIRPEYTYQASEVNRLLSEYDGYVTAILSGVDESWSDLEKVLYFNDYLAAHYEYDETYSIYDAFTFFRQKTGVCQAYAAAMRELLNREGISSSYAESHDMNHIWNVVYLDGAWYHVDVTWDDPVPDQPGKARHFYLLLSDTKIENPGGFNSAHYNWTVAEGYTCTSTKYDSYFWAEINTPFAYADGAWYYVDSQSGYLCAWMAGSGATQQVRSVGDRWPTGGGYYYSGCYSSLAAYHGSLIYNTPRAIMSYDPRSGTNAQIAAPDTSAGYVYSFVLDGDTLTYHIAQSPNETGTPHSITLTPPVEVRSGRCGDNLTWTLDDTGLLTIDGTGDMWGYDMTAATRSPFSGSADVKRVEIGNGVTGIGAYAFYQCAGITEITIPGNIERIGRHAFRECSALERVTLEDGVKQVEQFAFYQCGALEGVELPSSLRGIGYGAFKACANLTDVSLPDGLTEIGDEAFFACRGSAAVTIPASVSSIGRGAFVMREVSAFTVETGNSSYRAMDGVLYDAALSTLVAYPCAREGGYEVPAGVTEIADFAFNGCERLTDVELSNGLQRIGDQAFYACGGLTSVVVPDGAGSLGEYAFYLCTRLASVTLPDSIGYIGAEAFGRCSALGDVWYAGGRAQWVTIGGDGKPVGVTIHYAGDNRVLRSAGGKELKIAPYSANYATDAALSGSIATITSGGVTLRCASYGEGDNTFVISSEGNKAAVVISNGVPLVIGGSAGARTVTIPADASIAIALRGDFNGDGSVDSTDAGDILESVVKNFAGVAKLNRIIGNTDAYTGVDSTDAGNILEDVVKLGMFIQW